MSSSANVLRFFKSRHLTKRVFVNSKGQSGTHLALKALRLLGGEFTEAMNCSEANAEFSPTELWRDRLPCADYEKHLLVGAIWPGFTSVEPIYERFDSVPAGHFGGGHMYYTPAAARMFHRMGMKVVLIVREPRDWAYSFARAVGPIGGDVETRIRNAVTGVYPGPTGHGWISMLTRYRNMAGWLEQPLALPIRFEDLVGPKGGGTENAQTKAIRDLASHVGVRLSKQRLASIKEDLFGGTTTFQRGQIKTWHEQETIFFEPEIARACQQSGAYFGY
jgi:hypothetical protein